MPNRRDLSVNNPTLASAVVPSNALVVLDDDAYDQIIAEVEALPKRTRQLWKSVLLDKWGAKSRLAYREGKLWNYSSIRHEFVEAVPRRSALGNTTACTACSKVGQEVLEGANMTETVEQTVLNNYSGDHHRNHYIKIPKQSDGRLRG